MPEKSTEKSKGNLKELLIEALTSERQGITMSDFIKALQTVVKQILAF